MKKKKLMNVFFMLLPCMAVALATTADSVTVFDAVAGSTAHYSYFSLIPNESMQMLPPLAAMLCVVTVVLAAAALAKKKDGLVSWVKWLSMAAAIAAVMPILRRTGDVLVVPNAILPLLMMAEYVLAYAKQKGKEKEETGKKQHKGPRIR